jgi:hypothetical protein
LPVHFVHYNGMVVKFQITSDKLFFEWFAFFAEMVPWLGHLKPTNSKDSLCQ